MKYLFLFYTLLAATPLHAAGACPDLDAWIATAKSSAKPHGMLSSYAVVHNVNQGVLPAFIDLDPGVDALGFAKAIPVADAKLAFKLNDIPFTSPKSPETALKNVFVLLRPDAILWPNGSGWQLSRDKQPPRPIATPKSLNQPRAVVQWMQSVLGYDGVVVAVCQDQVLVQAGTAELQSMRQATVLANSADTPVLTGPTAADFIIEKVAAKGSYAIFHKILGRSDGQGLKPGAKVLFAAKAP